MANRAETQKTKAQKADVKKDEQVVSITLSNLHPPVGAVRKKKRVGRGVGSGVGKTSGRGQKGQKARSTGRFHKLHFEGGQLPLQRRLPKFGFTNPFTTDVVTVNVRDLDVFDAGAQVNPDALIKAGLIKNRARLAQVKILGNGEIKKGLKVSAHAFSGSAKQKIEAAGGSTTQIEIKEPAIQTRVKEAKNAKYAKNKNKPAK